MSLRPGEKIVKILDEFRGINRFHLGARKGNFAEIFMSDLKKKICYNSIFTIKWEFAMVRRLKNL
jgi:hypothetical protein